MHISLFDPSTNTTFSFVSTHFLSNSLYSGQYFLQCVNILRISCLYVCFEYDSVASVYNLFTFENPNVAKNLLFIAVILLQLISLWFLFFATFLLYSSLHILFILCYIFCLFFVTFLILILHYPNQIESILICIYILDVKWFLSFYFPFENNVDLVYYVATVLISQILVELSFFINNHFLLL